MHRRVAGPLWLVFVAVLAAGCGSALPPLAAVPAEFRRGIVPAPPPGGYPDLDRPYPLVPGDKVSVTVRDDVELNTDYAIEPDGTIEVWKSDKDGKPRERITARGMTVTDLKEAFIDVYERTRFDHRPLIQVSLVSAVPRMVYVRGAVATASGAGSVTLPSTQRLTLWRAIQAAGGLAEDADLSRVTIDRKDPATGAPVSLPIYDLLEMVEMANYDRDPPLEPNDIITIPKLGKVSVFGHIASPGAFLCRKGMKLTQLLAEAGWVKPFAKLSDVHVVRSEGQAGERYFTVNVAAILDGAAPYDPVVAPGDRIWIDEDWK